MGDNGPNCGPILARPALDESARVTAMVYVLVASPSAAVTTTLIFVAAPAVRATGADVLPDATGIPFTVRVAFGSLATGVTVMLVLLLGKLIA